MHCTGVSWPLNRVRFKSFCFLLWHLEGVYNEIIDFERIRVLLITKNGCLNLGVVLTVKMIIQLWVVTHSRSMPVRWFRSESSAIIMNISKYMEHHTVHTVLHGRQISTRNPAAITRSSHPDENSQHIWYNKMFKLVIKKILPHVVTHSMNHWTNVWRSLSEPLNIPLFHLKSWLRGSSSLPHIAFNHSAHKLRRKMQLITRYTSCPVWLTEP